MNFLKSTVGRKQMVGVAGLLLSGFILTHMLGNMLIFLGPRAYNEYSHALISNPLIYLAEAGLLLFFLVHVILSLRLQLKNWASRDTRYAVMSNGQKRTSPITRTLWAQGVIILVFVVLHLLTFKYGTYYSVNYGDGEIRDLYRLMVEVFQSPGYVGWYLLCLVILGYHVSHGVASSIQTLGFNHPRYSRMIKKASIGFAVLVCAGFISQPIYVHFFLRG